MYKFHETLKDNTTIFDIIYDYYLLPIIDVIKTYFSTEE